MSDFKLSQIAKWHSKSERTLRRLCIAGRVSGAYETAGGHWRIRCESPRKVVINYSSLKTRHRGVFKNLSDTFRRMRIFHASGNGRTFLLCANFLVDRVDQMTLTNDDRVRVRNALDEIVQTEVSPEIWQAVLVAAVAIWQIDAKNQGRRGIGGVAAIAGIPRSTFRDYYSRFLRHDCVMAGVEPEPCDFPEYADEPERQMMRLAAMHKAARPSSQARQERWHGTRHRRPARASR